MFIQIPVMIKEIFSKQQKDWLKKSQISQ